MDDLIKDCEEVKLSVLSPKARLALRVLVLSSAMYFRELYGYDRAEKLHSTEEETELASLAYDFYRSTVSVQRRDMRSSIKLFRYITSLLHIEDYFSEVANPK